MDFAADKYLPMELWTEILARLPVKTLLRFRCVCKSWCSLIDSSNFMSMHLECYNNNCDKSFVITQDGDDPSTRRHTFTIRYNYTFQKFYQLHSTRKFYSIIGCCSGLILLSDIFCLEGKNSHILWNPCVRKSLLLPPNPYNEIVQQKHGYYLVGYAPSSNDYKVVRFDDDTIDGKVFVVVYSVNDHHWRIKNIDKANFPLGVGCWFFQLKNVYFQGATYWIGSTPTTPPWTRTHAVYFNFDLEQFGFVELPDAGKEMIERLIFVLGDKIAMMSTCSESTSIWVMEKDCDQKECWRLWLSSGGTDLDASGDVLQYWWKYFDSEIPYIRNSDTLLLTISEMLYSYDIRTQPLQQIGKRLHDKPFGTHTYVESLVLHKGSEGQHLISLT